MVKNYMEIIVSSLLNEVIGNYNICKCDECIDDIKTIALNDLSPMYFLSSASEGKKTAFLLDRQRRISVLSKVIRALEVVSKNSHNSSIEKESNNIF